MISDAQTSRDWYDSRVARSSPGSQGGRRPGAGRPAEFNDRVRISVSVERRELRALEAVSRRDGVSIGAIARRAIQALLKRRQRKP